MNTAEYFIILQGHVYLYNKKTILSIGPSKPAKLKNYRYFLNTTRTLWPDLFSDTWLARDVTTEVCETDVTDFGGDNQREAFVARSTE